jgi:hypothetical protein
MPMPVPKPPKAATGPVETAGTLAGTAGGPWKEDRKEDAGADWMERNLFGGGLSSLLN